MRLAQLFLLGLILGSSTLSAQTQVFGTVTDNTGKGLDGVRVSVGDYYTLSDASGSYELDIAPGKNLLVSFLNFGYLPDTLYINIEKNQKKELNRTLTLLPIVFEDIDIVDRKGRFDNQVEVSVKSIEAFVGPNSGVEGIIKTLPGVSSYSELSSQYSVREETGC